MKADACVVAELDSRGLTVLTEVRSVPPLVLRQTPDALYLVGGAAGPLGGDDLSLRIVVGSGAKLVIRSAATSVALPGLSGFESRLRISAEVVGTLHWLPEAAVAGAKCRHVQAASLDLAADSCLAWREEVVLGRHGENAGSYISEMTLDIDGRPTLRQRLALGSPHPYARSPAVVADARAVGSMTLAEPSWRDQPVVTRVLAEGAALFALAGPAAQISAAAENGLTLRGLLDEGWALAASGG